ncbi:MAG: Maf family protein [Candidatus Cloacimonetes bacterium]|nr:Maf family protein [Candidatus Cloacimonadota bacterium]
MIHEMLCNYQLVLASASPRRKELFSLLGLTASIIPADIAEPLTNEKPHVQAMTHAKNKAQFVLSTVPKGQIVIAADTLVAIDAKVLGKPSNELQAREYLRILSKREHIVFTGICLGLNSQILCDYEQTSVSFAAISEDEISSYLKTGEPLDKAGAYGIQGYGSQFITGVNGCYFNVMGFPIRKFYEMLQVLLRSADL